MRHDRRLLHVGELVGRGHAGFAAPVLAAAVTSPPPDRTPTQAEFLARQVAARTCEDGLVDECHDHFPVSFFVMLSSSPQ